MLKQLVQGFVRQLPDKVGGVVLHNYRRLLKARGKSFIGQASYGGRFACSPYDFIQARILLTGVWEPDITALLRRDLKPGDVFVDVGANIGYFSVLAAQLVGPTGAVVSIEAMPSIHETLEDNLALNAITNVRTVLAAASDRRGSLRMYSGGPHNLGSSSVNQSEGMVFEAEVEALPLDAILTEDERGRVSMIKIDVEGAERPILENLFESLSSYPPTVRIICEFSGKDYDQEEALFQRFRDAGFEAFRIRNDYDMTSYLKKVVTAPELTPLTSLPRDMTDVLLSRPNARTAADAKRHASTKDATPALL